MFMRQMMGDIGQQAGMLSKMPGMKQMAMARRLNEMVKTGGLEHNPMMAGLADQILEAAVAGEGPAGARGMKSVRGKVNDKAKKKNKRKQQKQARRKSRR